MTPKEWMTKSFDDFSDLNVRVIILPLPPNPVGNVIYMPDCFSSKTFDLNFDRDEFKVIGGTPTPLGPAILAFIRLKALIGYDREKGYLTVQNSTCCATVSTRTLFTKRSGEEFVDEVDLNGLRLIGRSCHPGSHIVVPRAPYLTALLQYACAPSAHEEGDFKRGESLEYVTFLRPEEGEILFPYCDFDRNREIDSYIGKCTIRPEINFYATNGGLGEWATAWLRSLRHNAFNMEGSNYESWQIGGHGLPGDASQENGRILGPDSRPWRDGGQVQGEGSQDLPGSGGEVAEGSAGAPRTDEVQAVA